MLIPYRTGFVGFLRIALFARISLLVLMIVGPLPKVLAQTMAGVDQPQVLASKDAGGPEPSSAPSENNLCEFALAKPEFFAGTGDPFEDWIHREQEFNTPSEHVREHGFIKMRAAGVLRSEVVIDAARNIDPKILALFVRGSKVLFPRDPLNVHTDPDLMPFLDRPTAGEIDLTRTASRSKIMVVWKDGRPTYPVSLRMPVVELGPDGEPKFDRPDHRDARIARRVSDYLTKVDSLIGPDPENVLVKDVLAIQDKRTKNTVLVRDLSPMHGSGQIMSGFNLPFVFDSLARYAGSPGESAVDFWIRVMIAPMARAAARATIRYGCGIGSYHQQNVKFEFDTQFRPTGRIFHIDLGGWMLIRPIAEAAGVSHLARGFGETDDFFFPRVMQATQFSDEDYMPILGEETQRAFDSAFPRAYYEEVGRLLETDVPLIDRSRAEAFIGSDRMRFFYAEADFKAKVDQVIYQWSARDFLMSSDGLRAITRFHEKARERIGR